MTDSKFTFHATAYGHLQSKSNSRRNFGNRSIKSKAALEFVDAFLWQAKSWPKPKVPYEGTVSLSVLVWYPSRRNDLDVALLMDCLQAGKPDKPMAGIIKNDRQIKHLVVTVLLDKLKPRVDFYLEAIEEPVSQS